ncbi:MAG: MutT/Nudix [uncultured bacterium]|nr:MAG: MutT/Nudix [uncultured bacterium]HCU70133.1 DNA mismatch repair protein MutT [Candidatus Moranbacteria bacterium]
MKNRVRAIIMKDGALLTMKRVKSNETYWVFPGGGVENGKDNLEAMSRECKEELGVDVEVLELMFENSFVRKEDGGQREYFYKCNIVGGKLGTGDGPEYQENSGYEGTHELEWIKIGELKNFDIRPAKIKSGLLDLYVV